MTLPTLRVARPTDNLADVVRFYENGLGFARLDAFEDHDGFDGVMLGMPGAAYHLEFTRSRRHEAGRAPTRDNLLVFYLPDRREWQKAIDRMIAAGYDPVPSFNPYWDRAGLTFEDPDGYRIVLQNADWREGTCPQDVPMTSNLVIRPAVMSEHQALEALQRRASLNNPGDREALLANPDAIELPREQIAAGHVFVADADGVVVGMAAVICREDRDTDLDALFVDPELWRRGIGRLLVERCVQFARTHGSAALHVVGNPHAEAFYRACGFDMVGTVSTRFGVGLAFRKTL